MHVCFHIVLLLCSLLSCLHHGFSASSFTGAQDCHRWAVVESGMSPKSISTLIFGYCLCEIHLSCAPRTWFGINPSFLRLLLWTFVPTMGREMSPSLSGKRSSALLSVFPLGPWVQGLLWDSFMLVAWLSFHMPRVQQRDLPRLWRQECKPLLGDSESAFTFSSLFWFDCY